MRNALLAILGGMMVMSGATASAFEATVSIDARKDLGTINRQVYGHFIEPLGRCINQGIWAEILRNRKFWGNDEPDYGVPHPWRAEGKAVNCRVGLGPPTKT
jgi:hypothetical protein